MWENSYFPFISMLISECIVVHWLHLSYEDVKEEIDGQLSEKIVVKTWTKNVVITEIC